MTINLDDISTISVETKIALTTKLLEDLLQNDRNSLRLKTNHGSVYIYQPPANAYELARKTSQAYTDEQIEALKRRASEGNGFTIEEAATQIPEEAEARRAHR